MQGVGDVAYGIGHHDQAVLGGAGGGHGQGGLVDLDPEGRPAGLLRAGGEEGGGGAVSLGGEAAEMAGQLRAVGVGPDIGRALVPLDRLAFAGQDFEVGGGRATAHATRGRPAAAALTEEGAGTRAGARPEEMVQAQGVLGQGLVCLFVEGRTQRRVGGEVGHHQRDDGDRPDGKQEAEPQ